MTTHHWPERTPTHVPIAAIGEMQAYRLVLDAQRGRLRERLRHDAAVTIAPGTRRQLQAEELELGDELALLEQLIAALATGCETP